MHLVIFGNSSIWRGLGKALARRGHTLSFLDNQVPTDRDWIQTQGINIIQYQNWSDVESKARDLLTHADAAILTSFSPDIISASRLVLESNVQIKAFYDLDPTHENRSALLQEGLRDFDLILSASGGSILGTLRSQFHAKQITTLYGSVDPHLHHPTRRVPKYFSDLSYVGTYATDRQPKLEQLFLNVAGKLPHRQFSLAGGSYPKNFPQPSNIRIHEYLPSVEQAAFFSSSRLTLNLTRRITADSGYSPSTRLFEASSCGTPIITDHWEGLNQFFEPNREILIAKSTEDVIAHIHRSDDELQKIARAARERTLSCHTSDHRAAELESILNSSLSSSRSVQWGIIPAAGSGTHIQPLAFSKELLPVGTHTVNGIERPRAVSEFLIERMIRGGADRICFVLSPGKTDIFEYYSGGYEQAHLSYVVQPKPLGLCDAIFRSLPLIRDHDQVMIGLPDTVWFPEDGYTHLDRNQLSFLLFQVDQPQLFDVVLTDENDRVIAVQVKNSRPESNWIWGAIQMPGQTFHDLYRLWLNRNRSDEYLGTLINAYLAQGGKASGVRAGQLYVDVGTLNGYREATQLLNGPIKTPATQAKHKPSAKSSSTTHPLQ